MQNGKPKRVAIVGAGPVGLELAVQLVQRNANAGEVERKVDILLLEGGPECAWNVRDWAHVKLFSPWKLNCSEAGLAAVGSLDLDELRKIDRDGDSFVTAKEYRDRYLLKLEKWLRKQDAVAVHTSTKVRTVARTGALKGTDIGCRGKDGRGFVLLLEHVVTIEESFEHADVVVDCSGTYGNGNWFGPGGGPALGEKNAKITRTIPDVKGEAGRRMYGDGKTTAVVGSGYSAITVIRDLVDIGGTVHWFTRRAHGKPPYTRIADDPLPQRDALSQFGNALAQFGKDGAIASKMAAKVIYIGASTITAVSQKRQPTGSQFSVGGGYELIYRQSTTRDKAASDSETSTARSSRSSANAISEEKALEVDNIVSCCGYRPNSGLYEELQVHQCYATEGPMKLAAALMAGGGGGGDCLAQVALGAGTLVTPEENFFVLGMKSYGRGSAFLIKIGVEQVEQVCGLICGE